MGNNIVYVYGIGPQATENDLFSLFSSFGRILRLDVIKNSKTGQSKGYGFVVFETYEEACFACQNMNGYLFNNHPLQVLFKSNTNNNSNNNNIIVSTTANTINTPFAKIKKKISF